MRQTNLTGLELFVLLSRVAFCDVLRIKDANEFIAFSNNDAYLSYTVYLDNDIDFSGGLSERFSPINGFKGIFDGQGHTISNLNINISGNEIGIFATSSGMTVRNVVLDSTHSVLNMHNTSFVCTAGLISECDSSSKECIIEGIVNMGNITFAGNTSGGVSVSGIVTSIRTYEYGSFIRNCANYGPIYCYGSNMGFDYISGVVGVCHTNRCQIQNCLNSGTITHNASTRYLPYVGGILGFAYGEATVNNSFSSGRIISAQTYYLGSIVGVISEPTNITHCFWTSNVGYGIKNWTDLTITESSIMDFETTSIDELNSYIDANNNWNRWVLLDLNKGKIKGFDQNEFVTIHKILVRPEREEHVFNGWDKDIFSLPEGSSSTITALWTANNYTVTFDFGNGTKEKAVFGYDSFIIYPSLEKEGYSLVGWDKNVTTMPANNITLTAVWKINNYTVTFDMGTTTIQMELEFNSSVEYPSDPEREGYFFIGWDVNITLMPGRNITITALWTEIIATSYVEVVFDKKDLSKEEVEMIIKAYVQEDFIIDKFEIDEETGKRKVIIKFTDNAAAKDFVQKANTDKSNSLITISRLVVDQSFTPNLALPIFLFVLF